MKKHDFFFCRRATMFAACAWLPDAPEAVVWPQEVPRLGTPLLVTIIT